MEFYQIWILNDPKWICLTTSASVSRLFTYFIKSHNLYYSRQAARQACISKTKSSLGAILGIKSIHGRKSWMMTSLLIDNIWNKWLINQSYLSLISYSMEGTNNLVNLNNIILLDQYVHSNWCFDKMCRALKMLK